MRTTLTIDDRIAAALKKASHQSGKPLKQVVNEILQAGLDVKRARPRARRYRLNPASLGGALPGINLDKALALADTLEDEELGRKLTLRK